MILVAALPVGCRRPLAPSVSVERGERLSWSRPTRTTRRSARVVWSRVLRHAAGGDVEPPRRLRAPYGALCTVFTVAEVRGVGSTIQRKARQ